jgi:hypothetical protein
MSFRSLQRHFPYVNVSHGRVDVAQRPDALEVPGMSRSVVYGITFRDTVHPFVPVTEDRHDRLCLSSTLHMTS